MRSRAERERADGEHGEHDDRDSEERRDGRDLPVTEPRGLVDRDQPAEALVEVAAAAAVLERPPFHVAGPVDAHACRAPSARRRRSRPVPTWRVYADTIRPGRNPGARSVAIVSRAVPPNGVGPTIMTASRVRSTRSRSRPTRSSKCSSRRRWSSSRALARQPKTGRRRTGPGRWPRRRRRCGPSTRA